MVKIESVIAKLFLILSVLFAVVMIKYSFETGGNAEMETVKSVDTSVPIKKYYIPALRRSY